MPAHGQGEGAAISSSWLEETWARSESPHSANTVRKADGRLDAETHKGPDQGPHAEAMPLAHVLAHTCRVGPRW